MCSSGDVGTLVIPSCPDVPIQGPAFPCRRGTGRRGEGLDARRARGVGSPGRGETGAPFLPACVLAASVTGGILPAMADGIEDGPGRSPPRQPRLLLPVGIVGRGGPAVGPVGQQPAGGPGRRPKGLDPHWWGGAGGVGNDCAGTGGFGLPCGGSRVCLTRVHMWTTHVGLCTGGGGRRRFPQSC